MIIACPACATRYTVPDNSIGTAGRVVRCAKCRNSWFQDGSETAEAATIQPPAPAEQAASAEAPVPEPAAAIDPVPASPIEAAPPGDEDWAQSRDFAETPSSFAYAPPFRPRRKRGSLWLIAAIVFVLLAVAAFAAVAEFAPDWLPLRLPDWLPLPRSALAEAQPDLVLNFPQDRQQRRPLPNGSDFFNVSGTIRNIGRERRAVPMLLIVLRNEHKDLVYSLETASPKPVLAPGESEAIDQAIIDAPVSARAAEIGWKPR